MVLPKPSTLPQWSQIHSLPIFTGLSRFSLFCSLQFSSLLSHSAGSGSEQISHHAKPNLIVISNRWKTDNGVRCMNFNERHWQVEDGNHQHSRYFWPAVLLPLVIFHPLCRKCLSSCRTGGSMIDNFCNRSRDVQPFCKRFYRFPRYPCIEGCDVCCLARKKKKVNFHLAVT